MSKTAQISRPLILIGVLKGYLKSPIWFFLGTVLSLGRYKKGIEIDMPKEFIDTNSLIAWLYIRLQKNMSKDMAFEVLRAAILTTGLAAQQAGFRCVEEQRTFRNLVKNQKLMKDNGATKLNTMEIIEQSDKVYRFKVTKCMFYEFFASLDVPELTRLFCSIDNAIFSSYLPNKIYFHRDGINNTMPDGAKECIFVIENRGHN